MNTTRLLYLPGIDGTHGSGNALIEHLSEVECQQPSYPSQASTSLDAMADWVLDVYLPSIGWENEGIILAGESYGAALAQVLVDRKPQRFTKLVLLSAFCKLPKPKTLKLVALLIRSLPAVLLRFPLRLVARPLLLQRTTPEERAKFYRTLKEVSFRDVAARIHALHRFDGRELGQRSTKTIWIWGEADTLVDHAKERKGLRLARPQELAVMIGQAGHVVARSEDETLAMHVRRFIGLSTRSSRLPAKSQ